MKKIYIAFLLAVVFGFAAAQADVKTSYARKNMRVTLDLNWDSSHYGDIQWQQSSDNGSTWSDLKGETEPTLVVTANSEGLYRAKVTGDKACPPIYVVRRIKLVSFEIENTSIGFNTLGYEMKNIDLADAQVTEYGYCVNYLSLNRSYGIMNKVKLGDKLPSASSFEFQCTDLHPNCNYVVRAYVKTADGSTIYSSASTNQTIEGLDWTSEDWKITKNEIGARFEITGYSSDANPNVEFWFGKDASSLKKYDVTNLGNAKYSAEVKSLAAGTSYLARVTAEVDGELVQIDKTVTTLPDYSNVEVDNTESGVKHTVRWTQPVNLVQLSPEGQQVEYPRMLRVDDNKILLTYHGSRGSDHWLNCYLRKSYDNGATWSDPVIIFDKEQSSFGSKYWRIVNPEMTKLKNGWILMSCVANGNPETNENCHVLVTISKDGGETWGDPIIVGRGRTWEPQIVQLPGGELELFVSSEAKWWNGSSAANQEIVFSRSTDNGLTWTAFERASYNPGARDGMPVAIVQQGNKGVLFSIESVNGSPSPVFNHRNLNQEWESGDWDRVQDDRRWGVRANGGGAPYCLQLPTGEIVLSYHDGATGSVWQTSRPRIVVCDNTGHNPTTAVTPIPGTTILPAGTGAYYNSLFLKDSETVWLLVTKATYAGSTRKSSAIMMMEGKIVEKK